MENLTLFNKTKTQIQNQVEIVETCLRIVINCIEEKEIKITPQKAVQLL